MKSKAVFDSMCPMDMPRTGRVVNRVKASSELSRFSAKLNMLNKFVSVSGGDRCVLRIFYTMSSVCYFVLCVIRNRGPSPASLTGSREESWGVATERWGGPPPYQGHAQGGDGRPGKLGERTVMQGFLGVFGHSSKAGSVREEFMITLNDETGGRGAS